MHPGMSPEATLWLIEQGVKVMGIDAWGWDTPFRRSWKGSSRQAQRAGSWGNPFCRKREKEYCHLENLANLDRIPEGPLASRSP